MKTPKVPDNLHRTHKTKAKSLANLGTPLALPKAPGRPNLDRGGRTRTAVTAAEVDFCAYFVLTGNLKQASLQAGYSAWWGYDLMKMARVQLVLREFAKRKEDGPWGTAKDRTVLTRQLLDELFIQRLVNMKTHPKMGDLSIVKMFEIGYKRTGDTQPARVSAQANAGNTSQLYAKRLYLPDWRKKTIERIQSAEREQSETERATKNNRQT